MDHPFSSNSWNQWHISAAISIPIFALPGLILYFMVVFVIIRNPKSFANNPFYTFVLSLAVSDIMQSLACIFYLFPCMLLLRLIFGYTFDWLFGVVTTIPYYAGMITVALIALNRYFAVCRFNSYHRLFQTNRTRMYVWSAWVVGLFSGICFLIPGFSFTYIYWYFTPGVDVSALNYSFMGWDRILTVIVFLVVIICYVTIFR
jgi:hypothetical protein